MANPFAALNRANPLNGMDMGKIQSAYRAIANARNPYEAFFGMAGSDPRLQPITQALRGGSDPKALFESLCRQRGIDPQEFMRRVTGNNGQ